MKKLFSKKVLFKTSCLSTWSPIATAFNSLPTQKTNNDVGLFDISELTTAEGFLSLQQHCMERTDCLIKEITSAQRERKMVQVFDDLSNNLCKVADLAEFIRLAHSTPEYARAAETASGSVIRIVESLNTNVTLYNALKSVVDSGDMKDTTANDTHVSKLFMFDFEQSGIHLAETERRKVVELNDVILNLGQSFVSGSFDPRRIERRHLPTNVNNLFPGDEKYAAVSGLYTDSSDALVRESAYRIFLHPDKEQESLLARLLAARNELAVLCGFDSYSHRALKGSTMESPNAVNSFLNHLSTSLRDKAKIDYATMTNMKLNDCYRQPLQSWDTQYYKKRAKDRYFQIETKAYSPYFSLGTCMDGFNNITRNLYGISLNVIETSRRETWTPHVYKLAVEHERNGLMGYIYCDFYEREGKPNQDCHFTIRGGKELADGSYQLPIVAVMLNLPLPKCSEPSLLSAGTVDNLFHEMGHAMHSMLGRTVYQHVTGTRCSLDLAEVPSVLMEYFSNDPRVIKTFARHFRTGETMPDDMIRRLCTSKNLFAASETQLQVFYAVLDQSYHSTFPLMGSTTEILAAIQNQYYGLPYVSDTAWQLRFSHLVGYGAKYYSYLVSTAIASWIWRNCFQADPFSRSQGERFREEFLAFGGSKPAGVLLRDFLRRDFTPENLANALIDDLDDKSVLMDRFVCQSKVD